jgi:REP element-mobilizing transposase RayT
LCGDDPLTGINYDHRKAWLEDRLRFLAGLFGIDVLNFAILSNHFHLVLRNRPDVVARWSDAEVAVRWLRLCPLRKSPEGPADPTAAEVECVCRDVRRLAVLRRRLSDISWFMRMIAEPIARRANPEDRVSGRFWQGRFRAVKLCDEAAVLACAVYVDLNPIRAGLAETPEASDFTSVQRRIESLGSAGNAADRPDAWLAPVPAEESGSLEESAPQGETAPREGTVEPRAGNLGAAGTTRAAKPLSGSLSARASDSGYLPLSLADYLELVEWTGRQIVRGRGRIAEHVPPLPARLGIAPSDWLPLVTGFGRLFHRVAGAPRSLLRLGSRHRFRRGAAALLGR